MDNAERLKKNLARWACYRSQAAKLVAEVSNSQIHECKSESGVYNLYKVINGQSFLYHSPKDPIEEAKRWFSERPSNQVQTLFVYGIGLGYYYKAAQNWLRANEERSLVVLEDDLQVIQRFFSTEAASEFLVDRQAFLDYLPQDEKFLSNLEALTLIYSYRKLEVSALQAYSQRATYPKLKSLIEFFSASARKMTLEYISGCPSFYTNFFSNILKISDSFRAEMMFGKFTGIPAIICGAGPSLVKNIDLIGTLKDRALIFAGGSALNALNAYGIDPHFGLGVDPNPAQITRLVSNQAYETPFFYRTRMHFEALNLVHGDKIFVAKNGGHQISEWFEEKLGISGSDIPPGHNVLNLSLSLAKYLGCNPILVAGADLAYSQGESYATGIVNHPIHDLKQDFRTKGPDDELLRRNDIYGRPVDTTWKWVNESLWYYHVAQNNPALRIINVTEGGIGFPHIANMTLKEAVSLFLPPPSDLLARVACAVHNSTLPSSASFENVSLAIDIFVSSLKRCILHCKNMDAIISKLRKQMVSKDGVFAAPNKKLVQQWRKEEKALMQEDAYVNDLDEFNSAFIRASAIELQRLLFDKGIRQEEEIRLRKLAIDQQRYQALNENAAFHIELIQRCLTRDKHIREDLEKWSQSEGKTTCETLKKEYPVPEPSAGECYSFENGRLRVIDPEIGIAFDHKVLLEQVALNYPSGEVQLQSSYKDGILHGPSTAYAEDGTVLVRSWFWQGKRQGKMWSYYKSGRVYSLQRFLDGKLNGKQLFFYENGLPKTVMTYSNGLLEGEVLLWRSSGRQARQVHFVAGKRHGQEQFWDERGVLRVEANYCKGKPVGIAKTWHGTGQVEKEVQYDENSQRGDIRIWDKEGNTIASEDLEKSDYFDDITGQVLKLTDSLDTVYKQMSQIVPLVTTKEGVVQLFHPLSSDMEELKHEMAHLQSLTESLKKEASLGQGRHSEALWKTPSAQHRLEKQIEALNEAMDKGLLDIQNGFKELFKKVKEKQE